MDREWEPNLEDERVVELDDTVEFPDIPPTLDPEERIEKTGDDDDAAQQEFESQGPESV